MDCAYGKCIFIKARAGCGSTSEVEVEKTGYSLYAIQGQVAHEPLSLHPVGHPWHWRVSHRLGQRPHDLHGEEKTVQRIELRENLIRESERFVNA